MPWFIINTCEQGISIKKNKLRRHFHMLKTYRIFEMLMGEGCLSDGSQEVANAMAITQFRIVQTCSFWNPLFKVNGQDQE